MAYQTNNPTAIELYVFAKTDRATMQQFEAVARNLERKHKTGKYDSSLALPAWQHVATVAAKNYVREFCIAGEKWNEMFTVADRSDCAIEFRADWEGEIECGNGWL